MLHWTLSPTPITAGEHAILCIVEKTSPLFIVWLPPKSINAVPSFNTVEAASGSIITCHTYRLVSFGTRVSPNIIGSGSSSILKQSDSASMRKVSPSLSLQAETVLSGVP